jgi:hypothetical protein
MAQFARPESPDVTVTGWTEDDGTTDALWDEINEVSFDDATYVKSATPPGANEYETTLSDVTDPLVSTGHIMRWRRRKQPASGSAQINLTVRLMQTTTQITSQADNNLPGAFTDTSYTLSAGEADAITDYTALRIEFVAAQV